MKSTNNVFLTKTRKMKRELFFLVLIAFILIVFVETRKYMTKKVEPFTNDVVASEPVQLVNMGSVPGKAFEFLKAKNQTNATPSCIEPLLNRMNNFLKDYTAPSQDPSSQLLLQSVKADLQRLQDELKSARADPVYMIQLRKRDLYMIESNFNRLAGVTEGFQSSQCSLDSVVRVINDAKDLIIKIKQQNMPITSDINKLQPYLDEAYTCLKNLYNINSTAIPMTDLDTLVSAKKDLSELVLANNPDPPEYADFIQMFVNSPTMPEFSSYSNLCEKGIVPLITRDLKDTMIDSLINDIPLTGDDLAIYNNLLQASAKCINMLQPNINTPVIPPITSIDDLTTSTAEILATYTNNIDTSMIGSSGPTGSALSNTGATGSLLSNMGGTGSRPSNTGGTGSRPSNTGGYTETNYWNTFSNTGATGSGPTGGSTGSGSGLPGVTSSKNITLAQVKELVVRIDAEILRLS